MKKFTKVVGFVCVLPWALSALYFFVKCPWLSDKGGVDLDSLYFAAKCWTFLTGMVLVYVLFMVDVESPFGLRPQTEESIRESRKHRRVILLGLIGGFAIALPALAITILAFVTAFPHFTESLGGLSPDGKEDALRVDSDHGMELPQLEPEGESPAAYLFGVDISLSVNPQGGGKAKQLSTLDPVCSLMDSMFLHDSDHEVSPIIKAGDASWAYAFARDQYPLVNGGSAFQEVTTTKFPGYFREALKNVLSSNAVDATNTDVFTFLDNMISNARAIRSQRSHVAIVVFSDFRQDYSGDPESSARIRERVRGLMRDLQGLNNVHLLGISMPSNAKESGVDIRPYMRSYAAQGLWRELSLDELLKFKESDRKSSLAFGMFRQVPVLEHLYLKYQVAPWRAMPARVAISRDQYNGVVVGLSRANSQDEALSGVRISVNAEDDPFEIGLAEKDSSSGIVNLYNAGEGSIEIKLLSPLNLAGPVECVLHIAVPSRSLVYSVPVVILPVIGNLPMSVFKLFLAFMGMVTALLALGALGLDEWISHRVYARKSRSLSVASS